MSSPYNTLSLATATPRLASVVCAVLLAPGLSVALGLIVGFHKHKHQPSSNSASTKLSG